MRWPCWAQIRDNRFIAAGIGSAVFCLLGVLLLLGGQQNLAEVEAPAGGSWSVLLLFTLALGLLLLAVLLTLFCQEISQRQSAQEQLTEFQERLRSLTSQLSLAEERERRRIAVHLHDNIGQKLAIASIKLGQLKDAAQTSNREALVTGLNEIRALFKQIIQDTKSLTFKISSPILYELGLEAAVEWLTEELQNQHGIPTYFEDDHQLKPLDEDLKVLVFQAVSELLMNVVKHARARHVQVSVWRDDGQLNIGVYDDGVGFNVAEISSRWGSKDGGFGLFSIRERLTAFSGKLNVKSSAYGTTVILSAPLRER